MSEADLEDFTTVRIHLDLHTACIQLKGSQSNCWIMGTFEDRNLRKNTKWNYLGRHIQTLLKIGIAEIMSLFFIPSTSYFNMISVMELILAHTFYTAATREKDKA